MPKTVNIFTQNETASSLLWYLVSILVLGSFLYNSHRYVFKYGSSEFTDGTNHGVYVPTPIEWKVGKYVFVSISILCIVGIAGFQLHASKEVYAYSFLLLWMLIIIVGSGLVHHRIVHCSSGEIRNDFLHIEELEICFLAIITLPFALLNTSNFRDIGILFARLLVITSWILLLSNLFVVANFYLRGVAPFHYYEGYSVVRFGGLWDDPNGYAILSAILGFWLLHYSKYVLAAAIFCNVIISFSLTGYVLLLAIGCYYAIRNLNLSIASFLIGIILLYVVIMFSSPIWEFLESKEESLAAHASTSFDFSAIPLIHPLIFHESWLLSFVVNYPPVSYIVIILMTFCFLYVFLLGKGSVQECLYIVFFVSSAFLPILYMFPLNALLLASLALYLRGIRF